MFTVNDWQQFHMARTVAGLADKAHFSIALGNFDGMHMGHCQLIRQMVEDVKAIQGYAAVLSFHPHPMELIHGHSLPKIMTRQEKEAAIARMGVDGYILQRFDWAWANMSAEDFINHVLVEGLGVNHIYVGFNHSFGSRGKGNAAMLKELAERRGVQVTVMPPVALNGEIVSSSAIRKSLAKGKIAEAEAMLGYPFIITGEVVRGRQLGHVFGFPTANIIYPRDIQPISPGVYAVEAEVDGKIYPGVANCGYQPTIDANNKTMVLEVHILGEDMDLYGKTMRTHVIYQVRPEIHFAGVEDLKRQVMHDKEVAKTFFEKNETM